METATQEPRTRNREPAAEKPSRFPVKLLKNYVPVGEFDVIGYDKEEVRMKDAAGRWHILEAAEFVAGEVKPPVYPGTGFPNKIWAGTTISLPVDEARGIIEKRIAERADAIPG